MAKYVKTDGNNSNTGNSWAQAYATVAKAFSVATAGTVVYIAPGVYYEANLVPTNAGSSGNVTTYHGDVTEAIVDGDAATHGKGAGYVVLDASLGTGNLGWGDSSSYQNCGESNNWIYHKFKNLYFNGGYNCFLFQGEGTTLAGQIEFEDCIFSSYHICFYTSSAARAWTLAATKTWIGKWTRCIFHSISHGSAFYCPVDTSTTGVFNANPDFQFNDCFFINNVAGTPVYIYGYTATKCTWAEVNNCTFYTAVASAINGASSSYSKISVRRSYAMLCNSGADPIGGSVTVGTSSENYFTGAATSSTTESGWTEVRYSALFPPFCHVRPTDSNFTNAIIGGSTYNTASTDLFGTTTPVGTYRDVGAVEYDSKYPTEPVMAFPAGGGDFPDVANVTTDDTTNGVAGTLTVPSVGDVRSGTQYGGGGTEYTGTLVPAGSPIIGGSIVRRCQ